MAAAAYAMVRNGMVESSEVEREDATVVDVVLS